jgi:hypothetical protein
LPLGELFHTRIEPRPGREADDGVDTVQIYRQRYSWFLGPALVLLVLDMVLGRTRSLLSQEKPEI